MGSLVFLVFLWLVYIVLSIMQAYEIGGKDFWKGLTFGIEKANFPCSPDYNEATYKWDKPCTWNVPSTC